MSSTGIDPGFLARIQAFLAVCRTASLATVDEDGRPHAANIQYASDAGLRLFFVSSESSAHGRHIARSPDVALTVYSHLDEPETIHGLQIHGRCIRADAEARRLLDPGYIRKFPVVDSSPGFRERFDRLALYVVTPTWFRWIDNREHFGFKVEKRLGDGA